MNYTYLIIFLAIVSVKTVNIGEQLISVIPTIIIDNIKQYIREIQINNPKVYEANVNFYNEINDELNNAMQHKDLVKTIPVIKNAVTRLAMQVFQSMPSEEQRKLKAFVESITGLIKNFENQYQGRENEGNKDIPFPPQPSGTDPRTNPPTPPGRPSKPIDPYPEQGNLRPDKSNNDQNTSTTVENNNTQREVASTMGIDVVMLILLIIIVAILGIIGWYMIMKKRIKKKEVEKINLHSSHNKVRMGTPLENFYPMKMESTD